MTEAELAAQALAAGTAVPPAGPAGPVVPPVDTTPGVPTLGTPEELAAKNKALMAEVSGLNRKNNELITGQSALTSRLDALELEKLSQEERDKAIQAKYEADLSAREAKILNQSNYLELVQYASEKKIDVSLLKYVSMDDKDAAVTKLEELNAQITTLANSTMQSNMATGTPPAGVATVGGAGSSIGTVNPFLKETWNISNQIKLKKENPALYAQLKATV